MKPASAGFRDAGAPATLANWRTAPHSRWAFHHVRELLPTAEIAHHPRRVRALPAGAPLEVDGFLEATDTDACVVLHRGRIVLERYANGMAPEAQHILMSVSKSMLGLAFGALGLDPERPVTEFVPELEASAYRGATLRHLLDMRAAIGFAEDYLATSGPMVAYRKATGWNPPEPHEQPSDLRTFLLGLKETDGAHGGSLHYCSPSTDLLGWVMERATGRRYAELMSEHLWQPAGAEHSAYVTLDRLGAARAAGGFCATARDLARVGQWMIERGGAWIDDLERGGDPAAWRAGDLAAYFPGLPIRYRGQWYVLEGGAPLLFGFGIHGQFLCVDRRNEFVAAKFSSQPAPLDAARIGLALRALAGIRDRLAAR